MTERKTLEAISKKIGSRMKPRRDVGNKAKQCMTVHQAARPCCSGSSHARPNARACIRPCVGAWLAGCAYWHDRGVPLPRTTYVAVPLRRATCGFSPTYLSSLHFLGDFEASFESTLGRKLEFRITSINSIREN